MTRPEYCQSCDWPDPVEFGQDCPQCGIPVRGDDDYLDCPECQGIDENDEPPDDLPPDAWSGGFAENH